MSDRVDFEQLTERAMREGGHARLRPVIQKELLHYDILYSLDREGLLQALTFQGGTSLRLCYGANRFSEDLDFVGGREFGRSQLYGIRECIEHHIGRRYGLEVEVKEPKGLRHQREHAQLSINKWQVAVITAPARSDIPRQRIKIEVANIPAYSREPRALRVNYPFLPDGYADTLVLVETLDEIMADKLVSLVNTTGYVRHRDIWDLRWLVQQGAAMRVDWVRGKIGDYAVEDYGEKLEHMRKQVSDIIYGKPFHDELSRFIPQVVVDRTLNRRDFLTMLLRETEDLLTNLQRRLESMDGTAGDV